MYYCIKTKPKQNLDCLTNHFNQGRLGNGELIDHPPPCPPPKYWTQNDGRIVIEKTFSAATQRDQFKLSRRFCFN